MAYVSVPKDLTKVKNKVAFNLTKRQLICIGIGAAMGIPSYHRMSIYYLRLMRMICPSFWIKTVQLLL